MDTGRGLSNQIKRVLGKNWFAFFNKTKNKSDSTIHFKNVSKNLFRYIIKCTDIKECTSLCYINSMLDYLTK